MKKLLVVLCCLSLTTPLVASAEMYKWQDKNGKWQYSDTPPPGGASYTTLEKDPAPIGSDTAGSVDMKTNTEKEWKAKAEQDAAKKKQEEEKLAEEAKAKEERCRNARLRHVQFQQGGRVYRVNENGEREYFSSKEIDEEVQKAQSDIEANCPP
ncbi:MAG: DUF4124 domain-containing protein [Methylobacillus sp.]|jgi:FKBP-type peptidyl-prolyl cis-trans isomerase|nr:DUF4124 domain-containing protein [Methylobacillus sp.]